MSSLFLFLALAFAGLAAVLAWWPLSLPASYASLSFLLAAAAYKFRWHRIFGKTPTGRLPLWSWLVFLPYIAFTRLSWAGYRRNTREKPSHEIIPGLHLGCRLRTADADWFNPLGVRAVLDLTAEFNEVPLLREREAYRCLPVLDMCAPSLEQIEAGVTFIEEHLPRGPVYVHCALGHGRSAVIVLAYLLKAGHTADFEEALHFTRAKRPGIWLNDEQRNLLAHFHRRVQAGQEAVKTR